MNTIKRTALATAAAGMLALLPLSAFAAGGEANHIERQKWSFGGFTGNFDNAQLQRGYQVYKEVCAACHGVKRIAFRNLVEKGGPGFPEESVKALAATFKVEDGPNDDGKMFERPAKLSDRMPSPYKNEQEARSIHNGAYPPDLSNMAKARSIENTAPWYKHIFLMARDVGIGYQEAGADYIYALLTGYEEKPPAGVKLSDGMSYNKAFPGNQLAMAPPLSDGIVKYQDGTPQTVENYARDVTAFLAWTADPTLEQRKSMGWIVMLYLLITAILLFIGKKRIWANAH
jgi:ubiquinol-cytochrome c reductase cytochrome c1 subunit